MPLVNVVFSGNSAEIVGDAPRIRVKVDQGTLMFKPTTRTSSGNLPEGEKLRDLKRKARISVFSLKDDNLSPGLLAIEKRKYGWYTVVGPATDSKNPQIKVESIG